MPKTRGGGPLTPEVVADLSVGGMTSSDVAPPLDNMDPAIDAGGETGGGDMTTVNAPLCRLSAH